MAGFNIANFNLYNFAKRFWDMFGNPTPMDVEVPQKNSNGDIETYLCPNLAKFKKRVWDDVGGALGQFNRTFYVDSVNGNDNNSGTNYDPLKTLERCIDLSPLGSKVIIKTIGSDDENNPKRFTLSNKSFYNRNIEIVSHSGFSLINIDVLYDGGVAYRYIWDLINTHIFIRNTGKALRIVLNSKPDGVDWASTGRQIAFLFRRGGSLNLSNYGAIDYAVNFKANSPALIGGYVRDHLSSILEFSSFSGKYLFDDPATSKLAILNGSSLSLNTYWTLYKDTNDNTLNLKDLIDGIVYDTGSGNPLNVLSNENLSI